MTTPVSAPGQVPVPVPQRFMGTEPTVPAVQVPELFPGFQAMFTNEQRRLEAGARRTAEIQERRVDITKQLAAEPPAIGGPGFVGTFARGFLIERAGIVTVDPRESEALKSEFEALGVEFDSVLAEISSSQWRLGIINILPASLTDSSIEIDTVEDLVALTPGEVISDTDKEFAQSLINSLRPAAQEIVAESGIPENKERAEELFAVLQTRRGSGQTLFRYNPDAMTVQEILGAIRTVSRFALPEGFSTQEAMEMLRQQGLSDPEIVGRMQDLKPEIDRAVAQLRQDRARLSQLRKDAKATGSGEILSQIDKARWARAVSQPMIIFFKPFEYWSKYVSQPFAGGALLTLAQLTPGDQEVEQIFRNALATGRGQWEAQRLAFDQWEANGLLKFGWEVVADPLNPLGFGVYTKIAYSLPRIGRYTGAAVGAFERGWVRAAELPFDALKQVWTGLVPRTLSQRALSYSTNAFDVFRVGLESVYSKPLNRITAGEVTAAGRRFISEALVQPQSPDVGTRAGLVLLSDRSLGADEVQGLITNLGVGTELTTERLGLINDLGEMIEGFGSTRFLKPNEAATQLLNILDTPNTSSNMRLAVTFFETMKTSIEARAIGKLQGETTLRILAGIMDSSRDDFLAAQRSVIVNNRYQQGLTAQALDGLDRVTRAVFTNVIDRYITMPFARGYLLFGFYAPFNILENAAKTILAGVNPLWRADPYGRNLIRFHRIRGTVPLDILEPTGFSLQLELPEVSTRNLSPGIRLTRSQRREAEQDVRFFMEKIMAPRWLKNVTGFEAGRRIGGAQKSNYYGGMFKKLLTEVESDTVDAVGKVTRQLTSGLDDIMGAKWAEAYREEMVDRLLTGDLDLVKNIVDDFTPGKVRASEVEGILENLTEVYGDIHDLIITKATNGELWAAGPAGVSDLFDNVFKEAITERYIMGPQFFNERFEDMLIEVIAWTPRTITELNYKMNMVDQAIQVYGETISSSLKVAQAHGERLTNPIVKRQWFDDYWDQRVTPHVIGTADNIKQLIDDLRAKLDVGRIVSDLDGPQREIYLQLLDKQLEVVAFTKDARLQQRAEERTYMTVGGSNYVAPGKDRNAAWWDRFHADRGRPWDMLEDNYLQVRSAVFELNSRISGLNFPRPITPVVRPLVSDDIAKLFGVSPEELSRNMYLPELMVLRGKKSFTQMAMDRANLAARQSGTTAADLGYSDITVGRVYDNIMSELRVNPAVEQGIEPVLIQLETAREELIRLGNRRKALVSDDATEKLREILTGKPEVLSQTRVADHAMGTSVTTQNDIDDITRQIAEIQTRIGTGEPLVIETENIERLTSRRDAMVVGETRKFDLNRMTAIENKVTKLAVRADVAFPGEGDIPSSIMELVGDWLGNVNNSSLQRLGQRAVDNTLYQAGIREILREEYPSGFVKIYRGTSTKKYDPLEGREFVNVSADIRTAEIFQAKDDKWGGPKIGDEVVPDIREVVISIDDVVAIGSVPESEFIIPVEVLRDRVVNLLSIPDTVRTPATRGLLDNFIATGQADSNYDNFVRVFKPEHQDNREKVLAEVNQRFGQDFPDYSSSTAITSMMKAVYPFFTYEAHRWAWYLPREFVRHPGTYMTLGKYIDNTDTGYIHIPNTSLDVNPLRGTILQGGMRRLWQRDYPEFYDQFGGVAGVLDQASRYGFYPGAPIGIGLSIFGAKSGVTQFGEVLPAWQRTLIGAIQTSLPESEATKFLINKLAPDRFRDFIISREVSRLGGEGVRILEKRLRDAPLSDEEQLIWDQANRGIGWFTLLAEQTSLFKFSPEERVAVQRAADQIKSDFYGIDVGIIQDMRKQGLRPEEVFGIPLDPDTKYALTAIDGFSRWTGAGVTLMPSELQQRILTIRKFWQIIADERVRLRDTLVGVEGNLRQGIMTMRDWLEANADVSRKMVEFIARQHGQEEFTDVPLTLDERVEFAKEHKLLEPIVNAIEELRQLYFAEPLVKRFNYDTGRIENDWDSFFAYRNALEQSLDPDVLGELLALNQRDDTRLQRTYYQVNKELFRPYNELFNIVLAEFPLEEQRLILQHRQADTIRAQEIQQELTSIKPDQKLIAEFSSRLQLSHSNLRTINPELDAWLNIFNRVGSFKTEAARSLFIGFKTEYNLGN